MVWIYPEYGGQVAVRFGDYLVLRANLARKRNPGNWEAYNIVSDPGETKDLAESQPELVERAKKILGEHWSDNAIFTAPEKEAALN